MSGRHRPVAHLWSRIVQIFTDPDGHCSKCDDRENEKSTHGESVETFRLSFIVFPIVLTHDC